MPNDPNRDTEADDRTKGQTTAPRPRPARGPKGAPAARAHRLSSCRDVKSLWTGPA